MLEWQNSRQFQRKVLNFATEVYRIDDASTHIFKLMYTLLEIGTGQLGTWQDEASLSESMAGTGFTDLDVMFNFLGLTRLPEESYVYDPYQEQLTFAQWNEILTKDALFRLRIMRFFQALLRGGTIEGIKMMAESACGVDCQVYEMWRVTQALGAGITLGREPELGMAKEFVIIPLETITQAQRASIIHCVELLKPVNTVCTVRMEFPVNYLTETPITFSASDGHYFEVRRMVSASDDPLFQSQEVWIQPNAEVEGPTFAKMQTHDTQWALNSVVASVSTFTADPEYRVVYGLLVDGISDVDTSIVVDEYLAPPAPSFYIKIEDEVLFVTHRTPVVGEDTQFTYTVVRGQQNTTPDSYIGTTVVRSGVVRLYADKQVLSDQFSPWKPIPLADSPDNFPLGQFPGDPSKYDSDNRYLFEYASQTAYNEWFRNQIELVGGEVSGSQYRLPLIIDPTGQVASTTLDALAPVEFSIQTRVFPQVT